MADGDKRIQFDLGKIPTLQLAAAGLVLAVGGYAIFYMVVLKGIDADIAAVDAQRKSLEGQIGGLRLKQRNLEDVQKQSECLQARLDNLKEKLPSSADELSGFLENISKKATQSGVHKLIRFQQLPPEPSDRFDRVPIEMEFEAGFDQIHAFLWELSAMGSGDVNGRSSSSREQIINVLQINMRKPDGATNRHMIKVYLLAETFLYQELEGDG